MTAKKTAQRQGFKTGEAIVYPAHGVGRITAIEEQEIAGFKLHQLIASAVHIPNTTFVQETPPPAKDEKQTEAQAVACELTKGITRFHMRKVLINVEERELRVAILEDEQLVELYIESLDEKSILNNIYKGRVEDVLAALRFVAALAPLAPLTVAGYSLSGNVRSMTGAGAEK